MFTIAKIDFLEKPIVDVEIDNIHFADSRAVDFFDKDGYELTRLEQVYYSAQGYKVIKYTADHPGIFQPWISVRHENITIDHSCAMYRCSFEGDAKKQIEKHRQENHRVGWLLTSKQKWGLDLDIDYCDNQIAIVVIGWVIAGILYLTAAGKPDKLETAKKAMVAAIIGTALVVIAVLGYQTISNIINSVINSGT